MARLCPVLGHDDSGSCVEALFEGEGLVLVSCPETRLAFLEPAEWLEDDPDPADASWDEPAPLDGLWWNQGGSTH